MDVAEGLNVTTEAAIDLFILTFLLLAVCSSLPSGYLLKRLVSLLENMINYASFWAQWTMFARPHLENHRLEAIIHLSDAETAEWHPTYLDELSRFCAFFHHREHVYSQSLLREQGEYLKGALCEYLAKQFRTKDRLPVKIELIHLRRPIAPPEGREEDPKEFERSVIHAWTPP